jgi:hypothetical protein
MTQTANPLKQFFRQPSIYLRLPSLGQYWDQLAIDMPPNKELPVYPMTAIDEITYRTPDALFNGQAVINVIQSCIPAIRDAWSTPGSDLNAILVAIRIASYGHEMEMTIKCPACETESDFVLDLRSVLDKLVGADYSKAIKQGDLEIAFTPIAYRHQNETNIKQYDQQRLIQQIQMSDQLSDEQKIEQLNETLQKITTLTIETLKYSIASIRTPQSLVTEPEFIHEFLVNCDRKFFTEIRDHIIDLRQQSEIESIGVTCSHCDHKWNQTITLDQAAFFGVAS